jgi:protein gp37
MGKTKIEWTDKTWNPVTGCTKISDGCKNCYAETMAGRLQKMGSEKYQAGFKVTCHPHTLREPYKWKKPSRIFVCSMGDLFHEDVPFEFIAKVYAVMASSPRHTFQVLTKRPERMQKFFEWAKSECAKEVGNEEGLRVLSNVQHGVTIVNQKEADEKIPILLRIPSAIRFVSIEPMLGGVELDKAWLTGYNSGDESENEREDSLHDGHSRGTENRSERSDMAIKSTESGQVGRRGEDVEMQTSKSGEQHGKVLSSADDDRREEISCSGSSVDMVSFERRDTRGYDNKSHKRGLQRQSTDQSGISNVQRTSDAFNKTFRPNFQEGQARQISWIIVGGESGTKARPMHPDWVRKIRDDCQSAKVPFFFKQWGEWETFYDRHKDDPNWDSVPKESPTTRRLNIEGGSGFHGERVVYLERVGKVKAGSLLDGKEYKEFPEVKHG